MRGLVKSLRDDVGGNQIREVDNDDAGQDVCMNRSISSGPEPPMMTSASVGHMIHVATDINHN